MLELNEVLDGLLSILQCVPIRALAMSAMSYFTFLLLNNSLQSSQSEGKHRFHSKQAGLAALYRLNCDKTKDNQSFWQYYNLSRNEKKKKLAYKSFKSPL